MIIGNTKIDKEKHPERKGWFVGNFIPALEGLHSDDIEIKWGEHKRGMLKTAEKTTSRKTISLLIRGKIKINFTDEAKSVVLEKEGDYVFYAPENHHTVEVLEDSLVIVIRWPSKEKTR